MTTSAPKPTDVQHQDPGRARAILAALFLGEDNEEPVAAVGRMTWLEPDQRKEVLLAAILSLGHEEADVRMAAAEVLTGWYPQLKDSGGPWRELLETQDVAAHIQVVRKVVQSLPDGRQALQEHRPGWQALRLLTAPGLEVSRSESRSEGREGLMSRTATE
jgi:hypothetical protein